jgi:hypothetical protein
MILWDYIQNQSIIIGCYLFPYINPYFIYIYKNVNYWYFCFFPIKPVIIEPTTSEWINICSLINCNSNSNSNSNSKSKNYQLVNTDILSKSNVKNEYYSFYKLFYSNYDYNSENEPTKEHLFIGKLKDNTYICKVCFPNHVKYMFDLNESTTETDFDFSLLYVEYSHWKMSNPIQLPFNNYMLQPYNELFTPTFVLRQLQTQTEYYYFDMDYTLSILDSNLVNIKLNSTQYLLLQVNSYEIIQR